jgi:SAM-dependent methyltransferase
MRPGLKRHQLLSRYDVHEIREDEWHAYAGERTAALVARYLSLVTPTSRWLLNAGSGVYTIAREGWKEVCLDLFTTPLRGHPRAICGSAERMPFPSRVFGAVVCVGEVLGYCDPATALTEFSRVLTHGGLLICDFRSSRSARYWLRRHYGRAADLVIDDYNSKPEQAWIYDPAYVSSILSSRGFKVQAVVGTHTWSAVARRIGAGTAVGLSLQRRLDRVRLPSAWADLTTIVAERDASETG